MYNAFGVYTRKEKAQKKKKKAQKEKSARILPLRKKSKTPNKKEKDIGFFSLNVVLCVSFSYLSPCVCLSFSLPHPGFLSLLSFFLIQYPLSLSFFAFLSLRDPQKKQSQNRLFLSQKDPTAEEHEQNRLSRNRHNDKPNSLKKNPKDTTNYTHENPTHFFPLEKRISPSFKTQKSPK